ncbi:hypothetical protein [Streptomyces chattanoogensis]|uniref:hypothetical protein n=1 Tax=Streptomyces chattanoogensis TaxID=66876 RepID=UPI0012FEA6BE|nr:hypothetical protein [Streptomyces chattanoogensis]
MAKLGAANVWDTLVRGLAFANPAWLTDSGWWSYKKTKQSASAVAVNDDATFGEFRAAVVFRPLPRRSTSSGTPGRCQ